jgi:hypothetical protein
MVWIPPGTFLMGSPEDEVDRQENEGPQTQVTLMKGFWMRKRNRSRGRSRPGEERGRCRPVNGAVV